MQHMGQLDSNCMSWQVQCDQGHRRTVLTTVEQVREAIAVLHGQPDASNSGAAALLYSPRGTGGVCTPILWSLHRGRADTRARGVGPQQGDRVLLRAELYVP